MSTPHVSGVTVTFAVAGGGLIGFGFGVVTRLLLRGMQRWGASAEQQIALTVAGGYLVFYTANSPANVSGSLLLRPAQPGETSFLVETSA